MIRKEVIAGCLSRMSLATGPDEQARLLWEWVRSKRISLKEFSVLLQEYPVARREVCDDELTNWHPSADDQAEEG